MLRLALALLLVAVVHAPGHAQLPAPEPVLEPGDMVRIVVWQNPGLSGEFPIGGNGAIQHPLYRDVFLARIPLAEAEDRVASFLTQYQSTPQFTIEPLFAVFIGGAGVQRTGIQHLPPYMNLADAIRQAGGSTVPNDALRIRVIRDQQMTLVAMSDEATEVLQQQIRSGDQVVVERRPTFLGSVISPIAAITTGLWSIYSILNATGLF